MISKADKFFQYVKFILKGHIANPFWRPRLERRLRREVCMGEKTMALLKPYIPYVKSLKAPAERASEIDKHNEKIFTLWFQGEENAPAIVRKCLARVRKLYPERLLVLNERTLSDYIRLPDYITRKWKEGKISAAAYSDIVRIELLSTHGGYWLDSTDFLTGEIPGFISDADFFMYMASDKFLPHMFVQTCFLRAAKADPLLMMWRELVWEYWKNEDEPVHYFLVHNLLKLLVTNNEEAASLFAEMPKIEEDPTHVLWHVIGEEPFQQDKYDRMVRDAFFQKCSYKKQRKAIKGILPGSMADYVINGKGGCGSEPGVRQP